MHQYCGVGWCSIYIYDRIAWPGKERGNMSQNSKKNDEIKNPVTESVPPKFSATTHLLGGGGIPPSL